MPDPDSDNLDDLSPEELLDITHIETPGEGPWTPEQIEAQADAEEADAEEADIAENGENQQDIDGSPGEVLLSQTQGQTFEIVVLQDALRTLLDQARKTGKPNLAAIQEKTLLLKQSLGKTPGLNKLEPCVERHIEPDHVENVIHGFKNLTEEGLQIIIEAENLLENT